MGRGCRKSGRSGSPSRFPGVGHPSTPTMARSGREGRGQVGTRARRATRGQREVDGMQLTPRYGDARPDHLRPTRRRSVRSRPCDSADGWPTLLAGLDERQWSTPSRCEGWAVRDVVAHLVGTNRFWTYSITSGLAGEPTRVLTSFDPVATPKAMVEADVGADAGGAPGPVQRVQRRPGRGHRPPRARLGGRRWPKRPRVTWPSMPSSSTRSGIRGCTNATSMLPLGMEPPLEADELTGTLLYVAALGPAFLASQGSARTGAFAVAATDSVPPFRRRGRPRRRGPPTGPGPGRDHHLGRNRRSSSSSR